jgi:hypothetical protein
MAWLEETADCIKPTLPPSYAFAFRTPPNLTITKPCAAGSWRKSVALHPEILVGMFDKGQGGDQRDDGLNILRD